jgi:hypothetical protein
MHVGELYAIIYTNHNLIIFYIFIIKQGIRRLYSVYIYKEELLHVPITSHYPIPLWLLYIPSQVGLL